LPRTHLISRLAFGSTYFSFGKSRQNHLSSAKPVHFLHLSNFNYKYNNLHLVEITQVANDVSVYQKSAQVYILNLSSKAYAK